MRAESSVIITKDNKIYESIVTGIDEEIFLVSKDYRIVWANQCAKDKYGSDIIGKHCYYVTHGLDYPCQGPYDICPVSEVLSTGKSSSATHIHSSVKNGNHKHHVLINLYPIKDDNGDITSFVHIARDITDSVIHREMEEKMWLEIIQVIDRIYAELIDNQMKLEKSKAELEERTIALERSTLELKKTQDRLIRSEKLAAIGQLASSVAHELRNPLGVIKNSVYYLREQLSKAGLLPKYPNINEFLSIIENEISLSDKIIRDLLNFAFISKPIIKPTNVNTIIEYAVSVSKTPKNIKVVLNLKSDIKRAMIDPYQIQQAFNNIILNAYQAMENGGYLRITTREAGEYIEIDFQDTGCGIKDEDKNKVFDALFTTKSRGIGLGLAVTHGIIERHGGKITLKSEYGKGTTFTIRLPILK